MVYLLCGYSQSSVTVAAQYVSFSDIINFVSSV